jgi:hypothetical protein
VRKRTRDIRGEWRAAQRAGVFKFVHNDEEWQAERLALLVLNAYYAHDDREKRQVDLQREGDRCVPRDSRDRRGVDV